MRGQGNTSAKNVCKSTRFCAYRQQMQFIQVISHQVITGEQGKKYCEILPGPFERHDSEFSAGVPIEKDKY